MIQNQKKRTPKHAGFTLLELIVSVTILALMALMIIRIFSDSSRAVEQGQEQALLDETARLVLNNIEQDVSQALIRTNVAFWVSAKSVNEELYFISTGIRRRQETNPRDTAPLRLYTAYKKSPKNGLVPDLNHHIKYEYATGATDTDSDSISKLIRQSDYYENTDSVTLGGEADYTASLNKTDGVTELASLTFMDFSVNGKMASNSAGDQFPDITDMPRFVDVSIGLISSKEMQQAMRIYTAKSATDADDFLQKRERIYTRRIFMRNTGTESLIF